MDSQGVILVVDDRSSERAYFKRVLEWAEFDVVTAVDGSEALSLLWTRAFDLVLADIKMPNLDGYELYHLASINPTIDAVPFLFITAYMPSSDVRRYGEQIGAGPHLTKPVSPSELIQAVMLYKR